MSTGDSSHLLGALLFRGDQFGLTSGLFALMLLVLLVVYPLAGRTSRSRILILLCFSVGFYYRASGLFVLLLLGSSLIDFWLAIRCGAAGPGSARRWHLTAGILANLAVLVVFRYTHLWAHAVARVGSPGFSAAWSVIPLGVSFFVFQKMAYLFDVYHRRTPPVTALPDFLLYVAFFPRVLAGPIVRASQFFPQITPLGAPAMASLQAAVPLIMSGLLKKAIIADYIGANFVDRVFADPGLYSGGEALLAVYGYAIQIYCDFSGYTDLARGVARLVGVELPANFDAPYRAGSVTEFWRRWHITLSSWLRDYVFLPLAYATSRRIDADRIWGLKADVWIYAGSALVTWLICGLWHGAAWGFVAWGLIHGGAITIEKLVRWPQRMGRSPRRRLIARITTFHVVCLAWIVFRADTLSAALAMLRQMAFSFRARVLPQVVTGYPLVCLLIAAAYALHFVPEPRKTAVRAWFAQMPVAAQSLALAGTLWLVFQIRSADIQPFIYFRF